MQLMKPHYWILALCLAVSSVHAGNTGHNHHKAPTTNDHHGGLLPEGHTRIAADIAQKAGIKTRLAGVGSIERTVTTYGQLTIAPEQLAQVRARFPGIITRINARLGERVAKSDLLAQVESNESLTTYDLRSPINGVVIESAINIGEITGEQSLFTIAELTTLWAELRVFPGQRNEVAVGQKVRLKAEGIERQGTISHLLPATDNAPYSLARVAVDNQDGALTPGLLVSGDIVVDTFEALAVDNRALQPFHEGTAVFIQVGETYEVRPLELGRSDGVEVRPVKRTNLATLSVTH